MKACVIQGLKEDSKWMFSVSLLLVLILMSDSRPVQADSPMGVYSGTAGVMTFRAFPEALRAATQVGWDRVLEGRLQNVLSSLPKESGVTGFSPQNLNAYVDLGSSFCFRFVEKESEIPKAKAETRRLFKWVDLGGSPSMVGSKQWVDTFHLAAQIFWRRTLRDSETREMLRSVDELRTQFSDDSAGFRNLVGTLCTSFVVSPSFFVR